MRRIDPPLHQCRELVERRSVDVRLVRGPGQQRDRLGRRQSGRRGFGENASATSSPAPGESRERLRAGAPRAGERVDLGEHLAGGGARDVRSRRRGGGGGERGRLAGAAGQLDAGHVRADRHVQAGGAQQIGELPAKAFLKRRDHDRATVSEHSVGARGATDHRDRPGAARSDANAAGSVPSGATSPVP